MDSFPPPFMKPVAAGEATGDDEASLERLERKLEESCAFMCLLLKNLSSSGTRPADYSQAKREINQVLARAVFYKKKIDVFGWRMKRRRTLIGKPRRKKPETLAKPEAAGPAPGGTLAGFESMKEALEEIRKKIEDLDALDAGLGSLSFNN